MAHPGWNRETERTALSRLQNEHLTVLVYARQSKSDIDEETGEVTPYTGRARPLQGVTRRSSNSRPGRSPPCRRHAPPSPT